MATAIEFNNVSKQYRLGLVSTKTLSHDLKRWWQMNVRGKEDPYLKVGSTNDRSKAADSEYVWALKDIDFKIEQGDVVGIIGKNGAGKSTLLKLLSRVTGPTTGSINVKGRIGALLEVGTGFHPEMTGRENIYMNGAILGMTKSEIAKKLDEIVDFSGCERYIDTPVKRYSSGMTVRLGFAVAAHLDPEILVVDEVLAVGDAEFQKKAIGKMQDVSKGEGRTVLFVSHNMASIMSLCKNGILLENGRICKTGAIGDVVDKYMEIFHAHSELMCNYGPKEVDPDITEEYIRISSFEMLDAKSTAMEYGSKLKGRLTIESSKAITDVGFRTTIKNGGTGQPIAMSSMDESLHIQVGRTVFEFELDTSMLCPDSYMLTFALFVNGRHVIDVRRNAFSFDIVPKDGFNYGYRWERHTFGNVAGFELRRLL